VHPPADACDFARFCSQLDFYALTDHAEALNPCVAPSRIFALPTSLLRSMCGPQSSRQRLAGEALVAFVRHLENRLTP